MSSKLTLTRAALTGAPDLKSMFEMEAVQNNSIGNYMKTAGVNEDAAAMKYEREKVLFMKALTSNAELEKCDRFSIYCAWIELFASGSTLNDGCSYIIPYGGKAAFQMGYKGRLDQINLMPGVEFVSPAQVVYTTDTFEYELGDEPKIIKHKPSNERGKSPSDLITHVYIVIEDSGRKRITLMQRHEVIAIRDRYSKKFGFWRSKGGKTLVEDGAFMHAYWEQGKPPIELPFWLISFDGNKTAVDNPEAFMKTVIGRAYNKMPNKTGRMKAIDKLLATRPDHEDPLKDDSEITYGVEVDDSGNTVEKKPKKKVTSTETKAPDNVDAETGEVIEQNPAASLPPLANLSESY